MTLWHLSFHSTDKGSLLVFSRNPLLLRGRAVVMIGKMCNSYTVLDGIIVKVLSIIVNG